MINKQQCIRYLAYAAYHMLHICSSYLNLPLTSSQVGS